MLMLMIVDVVVSGVCVLIAPQLIPPSERHAHGQAAIETLGGVADQIVGVEFQETLLTEVTAQGG